MDENDLINGNKPIDYLAPEGGPGDQSSANFSAAQAKEDFLGGGGTKQQPEPPAKTEGEIAKQETPLERRDRMLGEYLHKILDPNRFSDEIDREKATNISRTMDEGVISIGDRTLSGIESDGYVIATLIESNDGVYPAFIVPPDVNARLKAGDQQFTNISAERTRVFINGFTEMLSCVPEGKKGRNESFDPANFQSYDMNRPNRTIANKLPTGYISAPLPIYTPKNPDAGVIVRIGK